MSAHEIQMARLKEIELRKQVTAIITDKVREIIDDECKFKWIGSKADLLELLHEVYIHGTLMTPDMRPMQMKTLVAKAFNNLGLTVMRNCYAKAARAEQRKGIICGCIADRMLMLLKANRPLDVIWKSLIS